MGEVIAGAVSGYVDTVARVNVRQGAPSTASTIARTLTPGQRVEIVEVVPGMSVRGNAYWYRLTDGGFIWSGGCSARIAPGTPPVDPIARAARLQKIPMVVDLYHLDHVTSFQQAKDAGLVGVIHKASTGEDTGDNQYAARRDLAKKAGLLWGAYHWGTDADPIKQAHFFLETAKPDQSTLVALDFEIDDDHQMTLDIAKGFCQEIFKELGRRPVIYSGHVMKTALDSAYDPFFAQHRLWLCQYGSKPLVQRSWSDFWLWQYSDGNDGPTSCRAVPGIPGDDNKCLDCNYFEGDAALLALQWAM